MCDVTVSLSLTCASTTAAKLHWFKEVRAAVRSGKQNREMMSAVSRLLSPLMSDLQFVIVSLPTWANADSRGRNISLKASYWVLVFKKWYMKISPMFKVHLKYFYT